jgi:hypothetical protein
MKKFLFCAIAAVAIGALASFTVQVYNSDSYPIGIAKEIISKAKIPFSVPKSVDLNNPQSATDAITKTVDFFYGVGCSISLNEDGLATGTPFVRPKAWTIDGVKASLKYHSSDLCNLNQIEVATPFGVIYYTLSDWERGGTAKWVNIVSAEAENATSLPDLYKRVAKHASSAQIKNAQHQFNKYRSKLPI